MRHCQESNSSKTGLNLRSMSHAEMNCERLIRHFNHQKIAIFHSLADRARFTAESISKHLQEQGIEVSALLGLEWIQDFMLQELCEEGSTQEKIEVLLEIYPDTFILIIGHQDDIAGYLDLEMDDVLYCSIYGLECSLIGHARF